MNVKWYGRLERILDINPNGLPDYYLVLTGPLATAVSSKGMTRPWMITSVYLFEATALLATLHAANAKISVATGVRKALWDAAEIYPSQRNPALPLTAAQWGQISLFHEALH